MAIATVLDRVIFFNSRRFSRPPQVLDLYYVLSAQHTKTRPQYSALLLVRPHASSQSLNALTVHEGQVRHGRSICDAVQNTKLSAVLLHLHTLGEQ